MPLTTAAFVFVVGILLGTLYYLRSSLLPLFSPPASHSLTTQNTNLNTHENGGTGTSTRKQRKRRGLRHRNWSDEEDDDASSLKGVDVDTFRLVSKPVPSSVKGCLKRREPLPALPPPSSLPFPSSSPPDFERRSPSPNQKQVRLVEPGKEALEALRELWSAPGTKEAGMGNGIAGYRRTRDIYMRGQGENPPTVDVDSPPKETATDDPRQSPRLSLPTPPSPSHSPSPNRARASSLPRLPLNPPRTPSPSLLSPRSAAPARSASPRTASPAGARRRRTTGERVTPKWIKSKAEAEDVEGNSEYEDVAEGSTPVVEEAMRVEESGPATTITTKLPSQPVVVLVSPRASPPPPAIRKPSLDRTVRGMGTGGPYAGAGLGGSSVAMVV